MTSIIGWGLWSVGLTGWSCRRWLETVTISGPFITMNGLKRFTIISITIHIHSFCCPIISNNADGIEEGKREKEECSILFSLFAFCLLWSFLSWDYVKKRRILSTQTIRPRSIQREFNNLKASSNCAISITPSDRCLVVTIHLLYQSPRQIGAWLLPFISYISHPVRSVRGC